jgi:hypothetical protein
MENRGKNGQNNCTDHAIMPSGGERT